MLSCRRRLYRALSATWRTVDAARRLTVNLLFVALAVLVLAALFRGEGGDIPARAALVFRPRGDLVEQRAHQPAAMLLFREGIEEDAGQEAVLADVVEALRLAAGDTRIQAVVLDVGQLEGAGLSKLQEVGAALAQVRQAGKPVFAYADSYTQSQYFLAAHADRVYLHPLGGVLLQGFGAYRTYYRTALDRLRIQVHVFSVGTYKSALEPFLRDGMSPADAEATSSWLEALWRAYCEDVGAQRRLPAAAVHDYAARLPAHLDLAGGDLGALAVAQGLVDSLVDRQGFRQQLTALVGRGGNGDFAQVDLEEYLRRSRPAPRLAHRAPPEVGLIFGRGMILEGPQRAGRIGSETLSRLLERAREDAQIRAVVLRLDTGGGSAFASEVVRRQVELTRQAGKPVVASFSSVAASGGYWIAAAADQIWASPTTLTGSIGIFGAMPSFAGSLDALGIHADGVATTPMAGALDPRRPLGPGAELMMQRLVERGYDRFLEVVAQGRGLTRQQADAAGQGRVWAGAAAQRLGLVDSLGGLDEATRAAAALAGLDRYRVRRLEADQGPRELLVRWLSGLAGSATLTPEARWLAQLQKLADQIAPLVDMNDPQGLYAWCPGCLSP